MNTIAKTVSFSELKKLVLELSVDDRWALLKLLIELLQSESLVNSPPLKPDNNLGWTPGFFERTAGAWQGEPLERGYQGE
jgi:hypothetical protein